MTHAFSRDSRTVLSEGGGSVFVFWVVVIGGLVALLDVGSAAAQTSPSDGATIVDRYQTARRHVLAQRFLQDGPGLRVLPPETLPTLVDSLHRRMSQEPTGVESDRPFFPLRSVRAVHRLERGWFEEQYDDTSWSFLGAGVSRTFFDTTRTQELRARLQAQFGDPTQTLGDTDPREVESEQPQFEYWFIVNDSIPVQVTDASGPMDRGLIVATERRYRNRLQGLRDTLLAPVRQPERAPYVDYYYDGLVEQWYRTGFDGRTYFLEQISRFDIVPGRRPRQDAVQDSSSSASSVNREGSSMK